MLQLTVLAEQVAAVEAVADEVAEDEAEAVADEAVADEAVVALVLPTRVVPAVAMASKILVKRVKLLQANTSLVHPNRELVVLPAVTTVVMVLFRCLRAKNVIRSKPDVLLAVNSVVFPPIRVLILVHSKFVPILHQVLAGLRFRASEAW